MKTKKVSEKKTATKAEKKATKKNPLSKELLKKTDAYWRAANYLSVGQLYLHGIIPYSANRYSFRTSNRCFSGTGAPLPDRTSFMCT
jgi:hypothetical protein